MDNIHPTSELLPRTKKEEMLRQKSCCIWLTGLSGSGKTTIAIDLEQKLHQLGFLTQVLDGDNIRSGINSNLGFSEDDRIENIRRIAEVTKLFLECGVITINCFVSPTISMREQAKEIIGEENFIEVFINTSFKECERRDVKGLYAKARAGEIKNFTGLDSPFEKPMGDYIDVPTKYKSVDECSIEILQQVINKIEQ